MGHLSHLKANVNENGEKAKSLQKLMVFEGFWVVRRVHLELFGGHVGLCWRILATKLSMLGASWPQDGLSWAILAPCCAILAARRAPRAPRRAKAPPESAQTCEKGSQHKLASPLLKPTAPNRDRPPLPYLAPKTHFVQTPIPATSASVPALHVIRRPLGHPG